MIPDALGPDTPHVTGEHPIPALAADDATAALDAELLRRLAADIARRRQVRTPVHVVRAVMSSLPSVGLAR